MTKYSIKVDGKELAVIEGRDDIAVFAWLHRHQGNSVDYALLHGGYTATEILEGGRPGRSLKPYSVKPGS